MTKANASPIGPGPVYGIGNTPCALWLASPSLAGEGKGWAMGYMSAFANAMRSDDGSGTLRSVSYSEVLGLIKQSCGKDPDQTLRTSIESATAILQFKQIVNDGFIKQK